jgi:hypothetical protein
MYEYQIIQVDKIKDGDTFVMTLDLGFGLTSTLNIRLADIDTPEIRTDPGTLARAYSATWFLAHEPHDIRVRTFRATVHSQGVADAKFGRWLGSVWCDDCAHTLAGDLITNGHEKGSLS